jgi:hypothetical protein
MRDAQSQASQAQSAAGTAAGNYGAQAGTIGAQLLPFETRQLTNPQGMSQRDIGSQLTAGLAGSGGATSGLTGAAGAEGMRTRNPMGFSAALDSAARSQDKAAAGVSEGVAANNANVKLGQQDTAQKTLAGLYGTDVSGQLGAQRNQTGDIDAEVDAGKSGWLQNALGAITALKLKGSTADGGSFSFGGG